MGDTLNLDTPSVVQPQLPQDPGAQPDPTTYGASGAPDTSAFQQPQPQVSQAPQPFWQRVLRGAMAGLMNSGDSHNWGQALAQGAAGVNKMNMQDFNQQQTANENASLMKFRDAQSGYYAAQASAESHRVQNLDRESADKHNESVLNQGDLLFKLTGIPFKQVSGADGVNQYASTATANGGISLPAKPLVGTDFTLIPDMSGANPINQQYQFTSNFADALGVPKTARQQFVANPNTYMKPALDYVQGLKPGGTQYADANVEGAIKDTQMQSDAYVARMKKMGQEPDPDTMNLFAARSNALSTQLESYKNEQKRKSDQSVTDAGRKAAIAAQYGTTSIDDGNGGTIIIPKSQALNDAKGGHADQAPGKGAMISGRMPDGSQVIGTSQELSQWGATGGVKVPAQATAQVINARQAVAPNGLIPAAQASLDALDKAGKLGVIASRWNDFMTGKLGSDPAFAPYRTQINLLQTALMQAHVGARGGDHMLAHFAGIMDQGKMDAATMRASLNAVNTYMHEKAGYPPQGANYHAQQQQQQSGTAQPTAQTHIFNSTAWSQAHPGEDVNAAIAYAKQQGYQVVQ